MKQEIEQIRSLFPYLRSSVGEGRPLIYFDSAATSQKPQSVIDAVSAWLTGANANVHRAIYGMAAEATANYEAGREAVRSLINASSKE